MKTGTRLTSEVRDTRERGAHLSQEMYAAGASACALVAGIIHLAVAPEHFHVSGVVGGFFLALAAGQLGLAVALLWAPRRVLGVRMLVAAVCANLAVIALYVASRTVELPFVPVHAHTHEVRHLAVAGAAGNGVPIFPQSRIEPVGVADMVCLLAELLLVVMMVGLLPGSARRATVNAMMSLGVLAVVGRAVGLLG